MASNHSDQPTSLASNQTKPVINKMVVIGLGLIGGSLSLALKHAGFAHTIVAVGRDQNRLQMSLQRGLVDVVTTDYAEAITDADLIFISVPLGASLAVFTAIQPHLKPNAVITDAGSAKACVIQAAEKSLHEQFSQFVPGHPIAGSEKSGAAAADAHLYKKHRVILTPTANTSPQAEALVTTMWETAGAYVETMDVAHHDWVLAATSHLPHLIAYSLVDSLAELDSVQEIFRYAAGGFKDFTRIASSDPVMWRDICLNNRTALLDIIDRFDADLNKLRIAIREQNPEVLETAFLRAKQARDEFVHCADPTSQDCPENNG